MNEKKEYTLSNDWHGKTVEFNNLGSGNNLDLLYGSADPGTKVVSWTRNGTAPQHWRLFKVNVDSARSPWIVQNVQSGTWLDIQDSNTYDGAKIHCWPLNWEQACGNQNGRWYIITTDKGDATPVVRLCGATSLTYIDVVAGNSSDGADVNGWHRVDDTNWNQYWRMSAVQ